jgi:5-methyltetrahydrofolate--homocysteine methyltransferase
MEDYGMQNICREINLEAARIARGIADEYTLKNPQKPRFVAGSVGPTNKTCSMSPDVNNPAFRALTFDTLTDAYTEQMIALLEGGVDTLLIETIFDTLNAKAAIYAAQSAMKQTRKSVPLMLSVTVADITGRTLSGQTLEAFVASISHAEVFSIGLNCSFGAKQLKPFLRTLANHTPYYISAYPNAGLPNVFGEYDETPHTMATHIQPFLDEELVNIIGGCCGTSPQHIAAFAQMAHKAKPRKPLQPSSTLTLAGLEALHI